MQSTLKQYFTGGICLKLEKIFFPFFPPLFPDFSAFISSAKDGCCGFPEPDVTLHPGEFKRTNRGGRERSVHMCVWLGESVV